MSSIAFRAHVNPLAFPEVDLAQVVGSEPSIEAVLRYLCPIGVPSDLASLLSRYREISDGEVDLTIVPDEQRVSDKLVAPLRHAKAAYMVGNYLATIALCGSVAEMLAILQWELSESSLNNRPMTADDEAALFGSSFERLSQDRRTKVLAAYGLIGDPVRTDLDLIRTTRRKYLHLWSEDHQEMSKDAVVMFKAAVRVAIAVFGQRVEDGKFVLTPQLMRYLDRRGLLQSIDTDSTA